MSEDVIPYKRLGTRYYKDLDRPLISGDTVSVMVPWNKETIIADHGKSYLSKIPKLDGFCCIPDHINFQQQIGSFYNTYHELPLKPKKGSVKTSIEFVEHIFGKQKELGLDYLKIIYLYPTQILPILCLVSKERGTGKSTFIKWLKAIFSQNMTYIKGDSFSSQFNADWASKTIIAVDEVFFDKKEITERLKYLSTTDKDKVEAKGKDREEIEFFGKFILCSNNEDTFILIDSNEIRFWVRKIPPFKNEDTEYLSKLIREIPAFLQFLIDRPFSTRKKSRMWFTSDQIKTKALLKLMWLNNNVIEKEMVELFYEIFDSISDDQIKVTPREVVAILSKARRLTLEVNEVRKILKHKWNLSPSDNSNAYQGFEYTSYGEFVQIDRKGRYYAIERKMITEIFDEMMTS
ncbi:primase-helicase family protein [Gaetbulibacter sp. M240]|uniref:primase-helicase family protein n=1 Tax=Gaetbulibacter sp. M240 TaxID=3126511 RepID=UPI00374EEEE4